MIGNMQMKAMKMLACQNGVKLLGGIAVLYALTSTAAFSQQGCSQNPPGSACATSKPYACPDCYGIRYDPTTSSYCDVRDGACGKTQCSVSTVDIQKYIKTGTPIYDGATCVGCTPGQEVGPILAGGTCAVAVLSGDQCGYCPPPGS